MSKRALLAAAGFLGLCIPLSAQVMPDFGSVQPSRFGLSSLEMSGAMNARFAPGPAGLFETLNNAWYGPAPLTLADGRLFSFPSAFAWTEATPARYLPVATLQAPTGATFSAKATPASGNPTLNVLPQLDYAGGEVGFFYGKSNGKYGREVTAGYILGEIVEGNTHISVGASYERAKGHLPVYIAP